MGCIACRKRLTDWHLQTGRLPGNRLVMQLVIISGLSGSGKSVALNVMEDSGHYVVDNLPSALLPQLVTHLRGAGYQRIAVAIDVRSGSGIAALPRSCISPPMPARRVCSSSRSRCRASDSIRAQTATE